MQPAQDGLEVLKEKMRSTWTAGDFGQIAQHSAKGAEEFVARIGINAGDKVLDIACGTGNLAIPAARRGAKVTGVDIAPNLLEQARQRAASEALDVSFDEGDAEQLPYADGQFDIVLSMFGAMFAPRPERVAAEIVRVCRPGGSLAMANWTPEGFSGVLFAVGARFVSPPEGIPPPVLWGDEATVKQRLSNGTVDVRTTRRKIALDYPFPPRDVVQFFRKYFGPVQVAFSKLDANKQADYAAELERLWTEQNEAPEGRTLVQSEYLEVIATRA